MSAIAGILLFADTAVEPGWVERLTAAMSRCGPDGQNHWYGGAVALGHCMLRTTPESLQEHQPLTNADGKLTLVWDGRLDNREELELALAATGFPPRNASDAELALQCYAAWGEECPTRLLGDFAFAVWDGRQGRLFCARDHMGARPFFYTLTDRFFAFASEDEALLELPGVSRAPSEEHIAYFLVPTFHGSDHTQSWLKEIRALSAAQSTVVFPDGTQRKRVYWKLQPGKEARYGSDEECAKAFLDVFGEAVRCRMRALGDIAGMVSGGLDSASILAVVRRHLPRMPGKSFHTYSAVSDDPENCLESRCILSLTRDLGGKAHHVCVPSFTGMLTARDLVEIGWSNPHPIDNSILLPAMMCLAASRAGHRVMLTGVCGDITTHGAWSYIPALLKSGQWRTAWRECRAASVHHTYLQGTSPAKIFLRSVYHTTAPPFIKRLARRLRFLRSRSYLEGSLINPAFARRMGVTEWHRARDRAVGPFLTDIQRAHILSMRPPHGITSSIGGYNRAAGRQGVELRDPWLDRRVVEFWLRLPLEYKFRNGWTKYLVRAALASELPHEVAWRVGREHVGWHFFHRLMDESTGPTDCRLEDILRDVEGFVSAKAAKRNRAAYLAGRGHAEREKMFDLATLASWLRRHRKSVHNYEGNS